MEWLTVREIAGKWNMSERSVRNYCREGRVPGAVLAHGTWQMPADALPPRRKKRRRKEKETLLTRLQEEKAASLKNGIYHRLQIEMTYNSNHIEGSQLSQEQTRFIYETHTLNTEQMTVPVDDIIETVNHFRCIDFVIDQANKPITQRFIKQLHLLLKSGTTDSRKEWFAVGEYKKLPNEVGGMPTTDPTQVAEQVKDLLSRYKALPAPTFRQLVESHVRFERIHPFQDGNGRIGRLLLLKECLRLNLVPFLITEDLKLYYYRGLAQWDKEPGYLLDTCLTAQDRFKKVLAYFKIPY